MTVTIPASIDAEGNVKVVWVPVIAGAAPTAAELLAGTDITCYLMPDWDGPTAAQNVGEDRRFCSKQVFDRLGRVKWSIADLNYTYDPQAATSTAPNKAFLALATGNVGNIVVAYGADPTIALAAGKKVDIFPSKCGQQVKAARGADEFAPLVVKQTLAVTGGSVKLDVVVV